MSVSTPDSDNRQLIEIIFKLVGTNINHIKTIVINSAIEKNSDIESEGLCTYYGAALYFENSDSEGILEPSARGFQNCYYFFSDTYISRIF